MLTSILRICVGLQLLKSKDHKIKKHPVKVDYQQLSESDETPHPLESDESDDDGKGEEKREGEGGSTKVEVRNVPVAITKKALKAFFEGAKSGGCDGAVASICGIKPGVFHVTFHDHKGEKRIKTQCVVLQVYHVLKLCDSIL